MGRKPTKCPKKCPKHTLIFKPNHHSNHFSRDVHISFCPPNLKQPPVYPIFNQDKKYYTSSFTLNEEKDKYETNDQLYRREHERFCKEQLQGKSQMLKPKPRTKNQYCHVCKGYYQDYLQHISSQAHKDSIQKNSFSSFIGNLIDTYFPEKKENDPALIAQILPEEFVFAKQLTRSSSIPLQNNEIHLQCHFSSTFPKFKQQQELVNCFESKFGHILHEKREIPEENQARATNFSANQEKNHIMNTQKKHQEIIQNVNMFEQ